MSKGKSGSKERKGKKAKKAATSIADKLKIAVAGSMGASVTAEEAKMGRTGAVATQNITISNQALMNPNLISAPLSPTDTADSRLDLSPAEADSVESPSPTRRIQTDDDEGGSTAQKAEEIPEVDENAEGEAA